MNSPDPRKRHVVDAQLSDDPQMARWLWAIEDARQRTTDQIAGLQAAVIDWQPPEGQSSIGTLLYHVALIEADWLYVEVLEQPFPADVVALFPWDVRQGGGLTRVQGVGFEQHVERLHIIRALLLDAFRSMDRADFRRVRHLEDYDVTPEWVLHHLMQHEAEHRGEIGAIRAAAERALRDI